jgi:hypothetical protein
MKALLLYPEFPEPFWSIKHILRFVAKRATLPALSLFTVAASLPDRWETRLIDVTVSPWREKNLGSDDMVLISAMIAHTKSNQPMSPIGSETAVLECAAFPGGVLGSFFDRRFGKDLLSMVVVPAARGSGCLMYDGQCRGWRGSVFRDDRATTRTRPPVA